MFGSESLHFRYVKLCNRQIRSHRNPGFDSCTTQLSREKDLLAVRIYKFKFLTKSANQRQLKIVQILGSKFEAILLYFNLFNLTLLYL